ncbi:MAG: hypothetical protein ACKVU2_17815 [Saprospiraceae bacterium]
MHNLDRIMNEEMGHEYGFLNEGEFDQHEFAHEYNFESDGEEEWDGEGENEWEGEEEWDGEYDLSQEAEYELAAELLAVNSEAELDQFLGKLVRRAARRVSNFAKSNAGRALIGGLKKVAKTALPIAGKVAGSFFGGPVGGMIGSKVGSFASNLFEVNLEGMSNEDREFEVARRVVRLSNTAARRAASGIRRGRHRGMSPAAFARRALKQASVKHAPGLLTPVGGGSMTSNVNYNNGGGGGMSAPDLPGSGTWIRQGDQIIVTL